MVTKVKVSNFGTNHTEHWSTHELFVALPYLSTDFNSVFVSGPEAGSFGLTVQGVPHGFVENVEARYFMKS